MKERLKTFTEIYIPIITELYPIYNKDSSKYTIDETPFGTIDYFPKANKVLIRKENKWIEPGLKWIKENFLK